MHRGFFFPEQACAAYGFITIPSLVSVLSQLHLYLVSGQVALLNQCFSQGMDLNIPIIVLAYNCAVTRLPFIKWVDCICT
jgi:hypothetical protein